MRTSHLLLSLLSLSTMVACFGELDVGSGAQAPADRDAGAPAPTPSPNPTPSPMPSDRDAAAPAPSLMPPETVATAVGSITGLALDTANVYWSEQTQNPNAFSYVGQAKRVALTGGTVTTLVTGLRSAYGVGLSGGDVFVGDTLPYDTAASSDGRILRVPAIGGAATDLVTGLTRGPNGTSVGAKLAFADASGVYYANTEAPNRGTFRADPTSGAVTQFDVLPGKDSMCALSSGKLVLGSQDILSIDGVAHPWTYGHAFTCAGANLVGVRAMPIPGNVQAGEIVLLSPVDGAVLRVLATTNEHLSVGLATDATHAYYTELVGTSSPAGAKPGGLYRVALSGGTPELIALAGTDRNRDGLALPRVNGTHVYWAESRGGLQTIRRVAK